MQGQRATVVVIGGGASAVAVVVALRARAAERGVPAPDVVVVGREDRFGRGLAYGRSEPHHRLNSPAGKMSVSAADDTHFLRWCADRGLDVGPGDFVHRDRYGEYLEDVLAGLVSGSAGESSAVRTVRGEVVDLLFAADVAGASGPASVASPAVASPSVASPAVASAEGAGASPAVRAVLADGTAIDADVAVLALGNPPPMTWPTGASVQIDDPWAVGALDAVPAGADVLLVGTGLTMVDVATTLARRGDGIRLTATSRHLLLPGVHTSVPTPPGPGLDPGAERLGELAHDLGVQLRAADAEGRPWQGVVDGMRPRLMAHWTGLTESERRRFLSHFARRWDVRRHRMAQSVHEELQSLVDAGVLRLAADVDPRAHDVVVFCTGPGAVTTPGWSPLVDALLARGRIVPEPLGLGLAAEWSGAVADRDGVADGTLLAIGHALRGALWETTAMGEIRILADRLADRALDAAEASPAA